MQSADVFFSHHIRAMKFLLDGTIKKLENEQAPAARDITHPNHKQFQN